MAPMFAALAGAHRGDKERGMAEDLFEVCEELTEAIEDR